MSNPIVYVCKEQMIRSDVGPVPMDFTPAMEYGEIEFITTHDIPLYTKSNVQRNWDMDVNEFVTKYDDTRDYIITTGQPTAIFAIGHRLGMVGKTPRFLVWRREENRYRPVVIQATVTL
jgi:hypothetical protein